MGVRLWMTRLFLWLLAVDVPEDEVLAVVMVLATGDVTALIIVGENETLRRWEE